LAQTSLPGNPLYPIKTLTQDVRIALTPTDYKPVVRMQVAKSRLQDIAQTHQKDNITLLSQNVQKDLETIPKELRNIQNKNKTLTYSKQVQTEAQGLKDIISQTQLQPQEKEALEKTSQEAQNQVLSLIIDTQDQINNCPTYLKDKLTNLQNDFAQQGQNLIQWPPDDINKVRVLVSDIENDLKAGNCLEAMDKIESINQILQIHSLDIKVETSKPESSD
jgi:deoxyribodipyrimidine photolyase